MEQKTPVVKKILNILLEIFSGLILFVPFVLVVQNSLSLHVLLVEARNSLPYKLIERAEIMGYVIYCLCMPYVFWLAGKNIWRSENIAIGFAKAAGILLASLLVLLVIFIFGPVEM